MYLLFNNLVKQRKNVIIRTELLAASDDPCSQIYHGKEAQSESEVRHLSNFLLENKDTINAIVTLHSYAQVIGFPYNYQKGKYPTNSALQVEDFI